MRYFYTISYIILIILVNALFSITPNVTVYNNVVSPVDILVGSVYVMRDLAQREIQHKVLYAMLLGTGLSYLFADKMVAIASVSAFIVGEMIDWTIYSFTKKPLSERLLWSSIISCPVDSIVFLYLANSLNIIGLTVLITFKILGVFAIWYYWRLKHRRKMLAV